VLTHPGREDACRSPFERQALDPAEHLDLAAVDVDLGTDFQSKLT
jgi:hypothetical protein